MPCPNQRPDDLTGDTGAGAIPAIGSIPLAVLPKPYRFIKRCGDILVASLGLVLLSPLFLVLIILVRSTSSGPAFFVQTRLKAGGRPFRLIKFRSMYTDAEARKASLSHLNETAGPTFKLKDDPRITPLGNILRRTSLDEMPQLWNVLIGDMSLVGPRPERPELIRRFQRTVPRYMLRSRVKAGMTGWAQINGWRGDTSLRKRLQYDLYYIANWSLALDLFILAATIPYCFMVRRPRVPARHGAEPEAAAPVVADSVDKA